MSATASAEIAPSGADTSERSVLLLWMIFTGLSVFAVVLLWRYGLLHLMVSSDRTLHFERHCRPLSRHLLSLLLADARDRA